jgi:hypothetical protein
MNEQDQPIRIPITDVLDLHSVPPRDVEAVVEEYLIEAHRAGFRALRIIHGRCAAFWRERLSYSLSRMRRSKRVVGAPLSSIWKNP